MLITVPSATKKETEILIQKQSAAVDKRRALMAAHCVRLPLSHSFTLSLSAASCGCL